MLRWILSFVVKVILNKLEPVIQDQVNTLFTDILAVVQGSMNGKQLVQDLASHIENFKKTNS